MLAWLASLLTFFAGLFATPEPVPDYVPDVAAAAAYASLIPEATVLKPKVPQKDCKTCNGTGRVRSGDGISWTKCSDCEPDPGIKVPAETPKEKSTTPPGQGWPARNTPSVGGCPGGKCPVSAYQFHRV